MPGRTFDAGSGYRYGFNGKENDNDLHSLTAYDYGFRIYNVAIGRFLSVDPLTEKYPELTPYQYSSNSPIALIDLDGLEGTEPPLPGGNGKTTQQQMYAQQLIASIKENLLPVSGYAWEKSQARNLSSDKLNPYALAKLGYYMPKEDPRPFKEQLKGDFQLAAMFGGIFTGGGSWGLLRAGLFSAGVNGTFAALNGENGYEIFRATVSGFVGGIVLRGTMGNSPTVSSILTSGFLSGSAEETAGQVLDNLVGNREGFSLSEIAAQGGLGAVSNSIAHAVVYKLNSLADKKMEIAETQKRNYKDKIKKAILQESPRMGDRAANIAANKRIKEIQKLIRKGNADLKVTIKQIVENGLEYLKTQIR